MQMNKEGNSYVVEEVIDRKIKNGTLQYKVKWKGYSMSECTWEPIDNFESLEEIQRYETKMKENTKEKNKKQKKGKKSIDIDDSDSKGQSQSQDQTKDKRKVKFNELMNEVIEEKPLIEEEQDKKKEELSEAPDVKIMEGNSRSQLETKEENHSDNDKRDKAKEGNSGYLNKKRSRSKQPATPYKSSLKEKNSKQHTIDDMSAKEKQLVSAKESPNKEVPEPEQREGKIEVDIPLRIKSAKQFINNPFQLLCEIEWKEGKNKLKPLNSYYTNDKIKEKYPLILLEYYEQHLVFPKRKVNKLSN